MTAPLLALGISVASNLYIFYGRIEICCFRLNPSATSSLPLGKIMFRGCLMLGLLRLLTRPYRNCIYGDQERQPVPFCWHEKARRAFACQLWPIPIRI
jgi:hypothetical protein